jgi:PleD family two-component response regulator
VGSLRDDDTVETFIKRADEAMYKAKNGRNQVVLAK